MAIPKLINKILMAAFFLAILYIIVSMFAGMVIVGSMGGIEGVRDRAIQMSVDEFRRKHEGEWE